MQKLRKGKPCVSGQGKVMKISVFGKQMNVRESLVEMIEKKLHKFDKFFGEDTEANVTCKVRKSVKIMQIS